ncbi:MAG: LexA family transcriptional regulator [Nitrospirota bacterium]
MTMHLKNLIHRELAEGLTEEELAEVVGVPVRTIKNVLADKEPKSVALWKKFAEYFRMDAEFLQTGGIAPPGRVVTLSGSSHESPAGQIRKIPLLNWHQIEQMVTSQDPLHEIQAEAILEATDIPGNRTYALKVKDNSMQPLFTEGEIIFVNPDLQGNPGDYVVVVGQHDRPEAAILRQLETLEDQYVLRPLNRRYDLLPLTKQHRILGKVIRLRQDL